MALADSLVLDPHKGFFLPYGCGAVLVRDAKLLHASFAHSPDYLQDLQLPTERSPSDFSIEGTRHFRALRMWLSMKVYGLAQFRECLQEKIDLARYAYANLFQIPGIEMGPVPQLSCVTFRICGSSAEQADKLTLALLSQIQESAKCYSSSTRLNGKVFLRLCILNFRTHMREIDLALSEIKKGTAYLLSE